MGCGGEGCPEEIGCIGNCRKSIAALVPRTRESPETVEPINWAVREGVAPLLNPIVSNIYVTGISRPAHVELFVTRCKGGSTIYIDESCNNTQQCANVGNLMRPLRAQLEGMTYESRSSTFYIF